MANLRYRLFGRARVRRSPYYGRSQPRRSRFAPAQYAWTDVDFRAAIRQSSLITVFPVGRFAVETWSPFSLLRDHSVSGIGPAQLKHENYISNRRNTGWVIHEGFQNKMLWKRCRTRFVVRVFFSPVAISPSSRKRDVVPEVRPEMWPQHHFSAVS